MNVWRRAVTAFAGTITALLASAAPAVDVLSPEPVRVRLERPGRIHLVVKDATRPEIEWTSAESTTGDVIPEDKIAVRYTKNPPGSAPRSETLEIKIARDVSLIDDSYAGFVTILTQPARNVRFEVVRDKATALAVEPAQITAFVMVGDDSRRSIRVDATPATYRGPVTAASLGLWRADGRKIEFPQQQPASAGYRTVELPLPSRAGLYVGSLILETAGAQKTVPVSITTRGPYAIYGIPLILFFVVLVTGYLISLALETGWSDAAIERLQTEIHVRHARSDVQAALRVINQVGAGRLPSSAVRFDQYRDEIELLLSRFELIPVAMLPAKAEEAQRYAGLALALSRAVETASRTLSGDRLVAALSRLDEVRPASSVEEYAAALTSALSGAMEGIAVPPIAAVPQRTADDIASEIERIRRVRNLLLFLVIAGTAYGLFFASNTQFGTFPDYFGVFLWSLGLTQAGAQMLTRARSAWVKTS